MRNFTGRASSPKNAESKPDSRGLIRKTVTLTMKTPLCDFMLAQAEKQHRSLASITVEQLEKYMISAETK